MRKLKVLFMQSQTYFWADSIVHALLMQYFDRGHIQVHVACNYGTRYKRSAAFQAISTIPNVYMRLTLFGSSVHSLSKLTVLKNTAINGIPTLISL